MPFCVGAVEPFCHSIVLYSNNFLEPKTSLIVDFVVAWYFSKNHFQLRLSSLSSIVWNEYSSCSSYNS